MRRPPSVGRAARRALRWAPVLAVVLVVCAEIPVLAQAPAETGQAPVEPVEPAPESPQLPPELEALAVKIFDELISPCCWTTTVATHGSGAAPRIQAEVRGMVSRGMSEREILDHYVAQFGERILAKPKKRGFNLAAYWVPYLAILAGAAVIVGIFRQRRRVRGSGSGPREAIVGDGAPPNPPRKPAEGIDEEYRRRLEEELRRTS